MTPQARSVKGRVGKLNFVRGDTCYEVGTGHPRLSKKQEQSEGSRVSDGAGRGPAGPTLGSPRPLGLSLLPAHQMEPKCRTPGSGAGRVTGVAPLPVLAARVAVAARRAGP